MDLYFEVICKLGKRIRISQTYWSFLVLKKHPSVEGHEHEIQLALIEPDQIRRSKKDFTVHLYYRRSNRRWLCVVAKYQNNHGFIITAYFTERIKEGERTWPK